jgi:hypothetical protein
MSKEQHDKHYETAAIRAGNPTIFSLSRTDYSCRARYRQQITSPGNHAIAIRERASSKEWPLVNNRDTSRRALLGGLLTGLAACTSLEKSSPFWGTIGAGFRPRSASSIDPDYVRRLPYATMQAWFDGGAKALVVLGDVSSDRRLTWFSAERQSLTTFGPFVVRLLGLDLELRSTILGGGWHANPLEMAGRKLTRSLDVLAEGDRVQVPLVSSFVSGATENVEILGTTRRLQRVHERVEYAGRRRFSNDYWVDVPTGRCWKSRQIVVPTLPPLNLEVTKYPTV